MEVRKTSDDAEAVIGFLQVLLRKISGNIFIIWDGSPLHRNNKIKAFSKLGQPSDCIWNNFLVMLPSSTQMRASGSVSGELRWAISVAPTWTTCIRRVSVPKNAYDTNARSSAVAHNHVATWFREGTRCP